MSEIEKSIQSFCADYGIEGIYSAEKRTPSAKIPLIPFSVILEAYNCYDGDFFIWLKAAYQYSGFVKPKETHEYLTLANALRAYAEGTPNKSFLKSVKSSLNRKKLFEEHALQIERAEIDSDSDAKPKAITIRDKKENGNNCVPMKVKDVTENNPFGFEPETFPYNPDAVKEGVKEKEVKKEKVYSPDVHLNMVPKGVCDVFLPLEKCVVGGKIFESFDGRGKTIRNLAINWTDREGLSTSLIGTNIVLTHGSNQTVVYSKYDTALRILNHKLYDAAVKGLDALKSAVNNISDKTLYRELLELEKLMRG